MFKRVWVGAAFALMLVSGWPSVARASEVAEKERSRTWDTWQIWAPVGGTLGASFNPKKLDNGVVLGGEGSIAFVNHDFLWAGGYVDAVHDFGANATRITIGPELGLLIFGVDGGLVLSTRDGVHAGMCGRLLMTVGALAAYARVGTVFSSPQEGTYGELGILVKIPIPIETGGGPPLQRKVAPPPPPPEPPAPPPEEEKPSLPVAI